MEFIKKHPVLIVAAVVLVGYLFLKKSGSSNVNPTMPEVL